MSKIVFKIIIIHPRIANGQVRHMDIGQYTVHTLLWTTPNNFKIQLNETISFVLVQTFFAVTAYTWWSWDTQKKISKIFFKFSFRKTINNAQRMKHKFHLSLNSFLFFFLFFSLRESNAERPRKNDAHTEKKISKNTTTDDSLIWIMNFNAQIVFFSMRVFVRNYILQITGFVMLVNRSIRSK